MAGAKSVVCVAMNYHVPLEPPPPEMQQLLGAVHGNQEAMDGFARVNAGVTSPAEFFSDDNVGRIFAAAQ